MDCFAALAMTEVGSLPLKAQSFRGDAKHRTRNDGVLLHPARIVRAFPGNRHVVDVAFAKARAGDADELRLVVEFGEVAGADIAHRGAQATGELVHDVADRAFI